MKRPAYALATMLVLLGVSLFGVGVIVTTSVSEARIARSQQEGITAYYVAEAGLKDALWRLNNNPSYKTAISVGNLDLSYEAADAPREGQGFSVEAESTSPGYAEIRVPGSHNNGVFTAERRLTSAVFLGAPTSPTGNYGLVVGEALSITNGSTTVSLLGGDTYSGGNTIVNNATLTIGGALKAVGNYQANNSTVTASGGIEAANQPPAPTSFIVPSFDFAEYAETHDTAYTPAEFYDLFGEEDQVTLPGPVTYISGNVSFGNWARDKTLSVNGLLVIDGELSVNSAADDLAVDITDPGTGKAGIFINGNSNNGNGAWQIDGLYYVAGNATFNHNHALTVDGALVAGGSMHINAGMALGVSYNAGRVTASLGGDNQVVELSHQEEEY